jgi:hypothetical protein
VTVSAESTVAGRDRLRIALMLPLGIAAAIVAALLPLARVVLPAQWMPGTLTIVLLVLAAGFLARRAGLAALAVTLI